MQRQPDSVASMVAGDPMFSHDQHGNVITRPRTCECGRHFTQTQLSERFLSIAAAQSAGAINAVRRDIPEFFVPVHCPKCERADIGRSAEIANQRAYPRREW